MDFTEFELYERTNTPRMNCAVIRRLFINVSAWRVYMI